MGNGSYLVLVSLLTGLYCGLRHYNYLSEHRPTKDQINKMNMKYLGWGFVCFVLMFLPYIGLIASIPFGVFFGLMLLNRSYEKTL